VDPIAPARTPRRAPTRSAALAAALALVLSGCSLFDDAAEDEPAAPTPSPVESLDGEAAGDTAPDPALEPFYSQQIDWERCGPNRCGTLEVPLDYAEPGGATISLALLKVPAGDPDGRVGSLVVNPGGPGGSGVDYASNADVYFGKPLLESFDVVGFDPRGVGGSTPIDCVTDRELDAFVAVDPDPDNARELAEADRLLGEIGEGCVAESGDLASHVSTEEAARDIDVLRAALGDDQLSYFGASYGTFLGATYAELFPDRAGRLVLDGAVDPSLSSLDLNLVQAEGFETALRAYVGACMDRGNCFLGDDVDAGTERIRAFLDDVEQQPLPAGERQLAIGNAVLGIWAPLYNEDFWPTLDSALRAAFEGNGAILMALSDAYTSRGANGYLDNSLEALYAVNCLDHDDAIPSSEVAQYIPRFEEVSPTFGAIFAYSLSGCSQWPVSTGREPGPIGAEGADPILVIGTTRDPATPLAWAESLAEQLESGVLVRRDGDGHTGYGAGNDCVDAAVEEYLVGGVVPEDTVDC
jgi:pimeloyl-ACP methyl ester carboxylesterase